MRWQRGALPHRGRLRWRERAPGGPSVSAGSFPKNGVGASCAWDRQVDGLAFTQKLVLGEGPYSAVPPDFILESNVVHALILMERRGTSEIY